jgi:hypothetical protein
LFSNIQLSRKRWVTSIIFPGDALSGHQSLEWVGELGALRIYSPSFFF